MWAFAVIGFGLALELLLWRLADVRQPGTPIEGVVLDADTGRPIGGARVFAANNVRGVQNAHVSDDVHTDSAGAFTVLWSPEPEGAYGEIRVSAPGYVDFVLDQRNDSYVGHVNEVRLSRRSEWNWKVISRP